MSSMTMGRMASVPQSINSTSTDQKAPLGTSVRLSDGREFVYAEAGGVALPSGRICQAAVQVANHIDMATTTGAVGDKTITVTLGATLASENQYADGLLVVTDDTGDIALAGGVLSISGHPAAASAATLVVSLKDALSEAVDANSTTTLVANKYSDILIAAGTGSATLVGVPIVDLGVGEFGWVQTRGLVACLTDGTLVAGDPVTNSDTIDGAVSPLTATQAIDEGHIGYCQVANADADISVIDLQIG
ncbi:hypothetical protein [uncultured Mediterranean phage]|nr:hypothetical protein [uncultured Mediterranean phage]